MLTESIETREAGRLIQGQWGNEWVTCSCTFSWAGGRGLGKVGRKTVQRVEGTNKLLLLVLTLAEPSFLHSLPAGRISGLPPTPGELGTAAVVGGRGDGMRVPATEHRGEGRGWGMWDSWPIQGLEKIPNCCSCSILQKEITESPHPLWILPWLGPQNNNIGFSSQISHSLLHSFVSLSDPANIS